MSLSTLVAQFTPLSHFPLGGHVFVLYISSCSVLQIISSVQSLSHVWTLSDPVDCSMPSFSVHHQLPEFTQTHVHLVGNAIQPSHLLLSPSSPAFDLSLHQGLSQWVSSLHQVAKVLQFQLQLPVNIQDWFCLGLTSLMQSKGLSRVFFNTTVQKG